MLLEKASQAGDRITELERLRGIARSIEGFQTRANMLNAPVATLGAQVIILAEFRKRGIEVDLQDASPTARTLKAHVNQVAASFEAKVLEGAAVDRVAYGAYFGGDCVADAGFIAECCAGSLFSGQ